MRRKKRIILLLVVGITIILALISSMSGSSKGKDDETFEVEATTEEDINVSIGPIVEETTQALITKAYSEIETEQEASRYIVDIETINEKPTKKKKATPTKIVNPNGGYDKEPVNNVPSVTKKVTTTKKSQKTTEKKTTKKKTTKRKPNNNVPSQSESYKVIGKSNTDYIRNIIQKNISGTSDKNCKNLAIYMAKNKTKSVSTAAKKLCEYNTLSFKSKSATKTYTSTSPEDVDEVAVALAGNLSGQYSKYGIGISTELSGGKYKTYVVLVYK